MGASMTFYLWLDAHDKDMVSIGVTRTDGGMTCWGNIHIDGVDEVFGSEVHGALARRHGSTQPIEVKVQAAVMCGA